MKPKPNTAFARRREWRKTEERVPGFKRAVVNMQRRDGRPINPEALR